MLNLLSNFSPYLSVTIAPASSTISFEAAISMILLPLKSRNASYFPLATYASSSTTEPNTLILLAVSTNLDTDNVLLLVNPPRLIFVKSVSLLGVIGSPFLFAPFPLMAS